MRITIEQKKDQCPLCHASTVVVVDVTSTGSSYGSGEVDHAVICPTRLCPHGLRNSGPIAFQEDCPTCELEAAEEQAAEEKAWEEEEAAERLEQERKEQLNK